MYVLLETVLCSCHHHSLSFSLFLPLFPFLRSHQVCFADTLKVAEHELEMRARPASSSSPFLASFQMRLAALRSIEECVVNERKVAQEQRKSRECVQSELSATRYPQLLPIIGLTQGGVGLLRVFPLCIHAIADPSSRGMLIHPVEDMCGVICAIPDLQLFSCWSPMPRAPLKKLPLRAKTAAATSGAHPGAPLDGSLVSNWCTSVSKAAWTVEMEPSAAVAAVSSSAAAAAVSAPGWPHVVAMRVCWQPVGNTSATNGAPRCMAIFVQSASSEPKRFEVVAVVNPEQEYRRQGTWTQTYYINRTTSGTVGVADARVVKLIFSKFAPSNTSKHIKMYSVEVLTEDSQWINTLQLMKSVQRALMPLLDFDYLERTVFNTIISTVRTTGSLSMAISFVHFVHAKKLDAKIKNLAAEPLCQLLQSIYAEDTRMRGLADNAVERTVTDAVFDDSTRTSNVEIGEKGLLLTLNQPTGRREGHALCLLSVVMESGVWTWEFSTPAHATAEDMFFGVARRGTADPTTASQRWWKRYRPLAPGSAAAEGVSMCRLTFDAEAGTLSMRVRGDDLGVIFEKIPRGVSPIVIFHKKASCVRLTNVRHKAVREGGLRPKMRAAPTVADLVGESVSIVEVVLDQVASLACARLEQLESKAVDEERKNASLLEFPYCVEISSSVIGQLFELLEIFLPLDGPAVSAVAAGSAEADANDRVVLAILQTVDAQFYCLSKSEIDPSEVGFAYSFVGGKDGTANGHRPPISSMIVYDPALAAPTVHRASRVLTALRQRGSAAVRSAAARAFARGAALFLPNIDDKLSSALSILHDVTTAGAIDKATLLLLEMLVQRLSHYEEVLQIIELYKNCPHARPVVVDILRNFLRILSQHSISYLSGPRPLSPSTLTHVIVSVNPDFRKTLGTLLGRFQEQLVYDIATSGSRAAAGGDDSARSLDDLMVRYHVLLVDEALRVLEATSSEPSSSAHAKCPPSDTDGALAASLVERHLHSSIVSDLLHPLLHGIVCIATSSAASSQLNLVASILPSTVHLLNGVSTLCHASPACALATNLA